MNDSECHECYIQKKKKKLTKNRIQKKLHYK